MRREHARLRVEDNFLKDISQKNMGREGNGDFPLSYRCFPTFP